MNRTPSPRRLGRSVVAVLAGMAVAIGATLATDWFFHAIGVFPPPGQRAPDGPLALATAYRAAYGIAASYLTARLAPYRPMAHSLTGGGFGFAASLAGAIATWNGGPAFEPHWYPVALVILALPQAWAGGWLRVRQLGAEPGF